jgi:hypothetical protein
LANPVKVLLASPESSASGIPKAKSGANRRGNRDSQHDYLKEAIQLCSEILQQASAGPSDAQEENPPKLEPILSSMDVDDDGMNSGDEWHRMEGRLVD